MILRVKHILLFLYVLCFSEIYAQQPSFYIIGKEELSEINVYSMFQDDKANVWISSNRGLLKYNGYEFKEYPSDNFQNRSLFGLRSDNKGEIFCFNLSGQIFHVENDSLKLYYQIPSSLQSTKLNFNFDEKNQLIILCKKVLLLNDKKEVSVLIEETVSSWKFPKNEEGELVFLFNNEEKLVYYKNGKFRSVQLPKTPELERLNKSGFNASVCNNPNYVIGNFSSSIFQVVDTGLKRIEIPKTDDLIKVGEASHITAQSDIWITSRNKGAFVFDTLGKSIYRQERILKDYFISDFMEDREGNMWLGTFGKGIIIIPNRNVCEFSSNNLMNDDFINTIEADDKGNLYFGGQNGILYRLSTQDSLEIVREERQTFELIFHIPKSNSLLLNSPQNVLYQIDSKKDSILKIATLKNFFSLNDTEKLMATSAGLTLLSPDNDFQPFYDQFSKFNDAKIEKGVLHFDLSRCSDVAYDEKTNTIWAATFRGLMKINEDGIEEFKNGNKSIPILDLQFDNDTLWLATVDNGINTIFEGQLDFFLREKDGLYSNYTSQIKKDGDLLYIAEKGAFQSVNLVNGEIRTFTRPDGLNSNSIRDFVVTKDWIWLASGAGVQKFRFGDIQENQTKPSIEFERFEVNDKEHSLLGESSFDHRENRMEFHFVAKAYRHRGLLKYTYMLEGLENEDWQTVDANHNFIKYPSLHSGEYTFKVKAMNENNISSETLSYSFSIKKPFWKAWWFYLICGLILGAFIFIFFLIRIGVVKERMELEKQIKASEVTAIKAQMNPHFVFNALNSVQDLIIQKDIRGSTNYLGKFADLMRKTLEVSELELIPLNEEIEMLELYLDLEKLRFTEDFNYELIVELNEELRESLMIHSMLLQPYVENAIKHGLLHKDGSKELLVKFHIENQNLICEIIDNGVGRKASLEINKRRARFHKSFATQANRKRIDLINESSNHSIELHISDIVKRGKIEGTLVKFKLPIIEDK